MTMTDMTVQLLFRSRVLSVLALRHGHALCATERQYRLLEQSDDHRE